MSRRVAFKITGAPAIHKGVPRAKGRPRAVPRIHYPAGGAPEAVVSLVTPAETREAEKAIRAAFRRAHPDHKPFVGPVLLRFTAVFETPRSFPRKLRDAAARGELYATRKPDKDNIEKLIVDALNGIAFVDDAQVMGGGLKRYGSPARIEVSFESLASDAVPPTPGDRRAARAQQAPLPLGPPKARKPNPSKSKAAAPATPALDASPRVVPSLAGYSERQRDLILRAMERDEAAKRDRRR